MKNAYQLTLDGVSIDVERRRIKNLYLRVQPDGRVLLTAPRLTPEFMIERFARERLPWVKKHRQTAVPQADVRYETGETLPVFGERYPLVVEYAGQRARVELLDGALRLRVPADSTPEDRKRALDNWYRRELEDAIARFTPACERITGRCASLWRIRDMKTRWGTCNTKTGAITINLQLARRAPLYLNYVMLHELTHLLEPSHNASFYAYMDRFCPDWKRIRKALKEGN